MQLSEKWLREFVNPSINSDELVEALTMLGLEVDSQTPVAGEFKSVVVGHVLSAEQHPNADRLKFCRVDLGQQQPVEVVCGGVNVREGLKVAFIQVGGELPGGFKIKKAKLRGVESSGMICSAKELGMGEDEAGHILELAQDAPIGQDFREYLQLDDYMIDVELTPNRGDCASVLGVARDLAAKFNLPVTMPDIQPIKALAKTALTVNLDAGEGCSRYVGRVINHVNASVPTPMWMQERLRRSGLRSINAVVDISNYVMLELGQPNHAFDLDKLQGDISVRLAKKGEKLKLLDEQEVTLDEKIIVIADQKGVQAVAGVMGGLDTSVDENTTNIFLESAYFNPGDVCRASRALNLTTDSSYRFERGVDFNLQEKAAERFTQLLLEICGGEPGPIQTVSLQKYLPEVKSMLLRRAQIKRVLGIDIDDQTVETILAGLGMQVIANDQGWQVTPPTYRFDIKIEVDLIEELMRLHGYEHLPATNVLGELRVPKTAVLKLPFLRLQQLLTDIGFSEAITYSFVDPDMQRLFDKESNFLVLANPLSKEHSVMRTSLWPGLVQAFQYNSNRQVERLRLFEVGLCFKKEGGEIKQTAKLSGLMAGHACELQWGQANRQVDFFDIKGEVEKIFALTHQDKKMTWKKSSHAILHPGQSSDVYINDALVGSVGALHPELVENLGLSLAPYVFEFDLFKIESISPVKFNLISKFPAVRRDLAIVIDDNISAGTIAENVRKFAGHLLRDVKIFDIYHGEGIEFGKKSVAIGLFFQDPERTLVDEEVTSVMARVVSGLEEQFKATLRA